MKTCIKWALCLAVLGSSLEAGLVWRPGEGWSRESDGAVISASDAKEQLLLGRSLEAKEQWGDALEAYRLLTKRWPLASVAGEAQFKVGLMFEKIAKFESAFKAYQKVVSKHPGSQFFDLAIERQYSIGNLYLAGERRRIWDIPLLPSMEKAVEMYNSVIKNAPYGKYAAASYFKIGIAREKQKKWTSAIESYNTIIDKYPAHELADDAQYQIGYAWYRASSDADYDQSAARKSIDAFRDFETRYPKSEKITQAKDYISELTGRQVQGSYNIARFYETQRNYKAAFIYYNDVISIAPESKQAEDSKLRIEALRPRLEEAGYPFAIKEDEEAKGQARAE